MVTERHKLAAANIGKYGSLQKAMIKANYSPSYSRSGLINKTKGWQEIFNADKLKQKVVKTVAESLDAVKIHSSYTGPDIEMPDHPVRLKGAELIIRTGGGLRDGSYGEGQRPQPIIGVQVNVRVEHGEKNDAKKED